MPSPWSGPQPTAGQIEWWLRKRRAEGATLRIEGHELDGALMSFWCASDEDGILYDWYPAEPRDKEERGEQVRVAQRGRSQRLKAAANLAGFETIDRLAAAINDGSVVVIKQ
jgi:hypothetical protein